MKYYLIILAEILRDMLFYGINDRGYCYPALSLGFTNTLTDRISQDCPKRYEI